MVFNAAISREFGSLAAASDQCGPVFENSHNCDTKEGVETTTAAYAGTRGSFGRVELDPRLRYESTRIWNRFWVMSRTDGGDLPGAFARNQSQYDKLLRNLGTAYRPNETDSFRVQL